MSLDNRTVGGVEVTPELLAYWFWEMDGREQADFFASLYREAGRSTLCMQTAYIVQELRYRAERGDSDGLSGFQTMLAHSQDYVLSGIEARSWEAERDLRDMVDRAKEQICSPVP